jgi:tetratricopeptide (TPR) repeat protein
MKNSRMKSVQMFTIALIVSVCGIFSQPLCAMDVKAEFEKADAYYVSGLEPEAALEIYRAIVFSGASRTFDRLSKFKIGLILDEQLLRYEEAIDAYQLFLDEYPTGGLARVARANKEYLDMVKAAEALDPYWEYKKIERRHHCLVRTEGSSKREKQELALAMYQHALENHQEPFYERLLASALSMTFQERLYVHSGRLIAFIDEEHPDVKEVYAMCLGAVQLRSRRIHMHEAGWGYIALCLLFVIIRKGYKQLIPEFQQHGLFYSIFFVVTATYLSVWYLIAVTQNYSTETELAYHIYYMWVQFLVLFPLSLAFYHSFPPAWTGFKRVLPVMLSLLLGVSGWMAFGYRFDYIWVIGNVFGMDI